MSTISEGLLNELYDGCTEGFPIDAATGQHLIQVYRELMRQLEAYRSDNYDKLSIVDGNDYAAMQQRAEATERREKVAMRALEIATAGSTGLYRSSLEQSEKEIGNE